MVKVSITLPNNAQITFESEEPEVIHEVVGMVLRDLPRELMQSSVSPNGNGGHQADAAPGNGTVAAKLDSSPVVSSPQDDEDAGEQGTTAPPTEAPARRSVENKGRVSRAPGVKANLTDAEQEFVQFCREANPLGDMRRVVVAAEGASRYLDYGSVDADELGRLFDLVGWQRPHSFVQTLRNAARSKFRWLERVPGRSGHYTVTDLGRSTAFGS